MLLNRKTRSICHGRMGKGNNRCSRMNVHVLAKSLLGAVKSKANCDVTTRPDCHWHCCFHSFSARKKLETAYGHTSTSQLWILALAGRVQVMKKCHENSGGYACVYCIW